MTVAALYIDPRGPYPKLLGPELCWDEARDARTYAGPWPVVAHPPCQLWVNLAALNFKRYGGEHNRPGNDGGCFGSALAIVRCFGGVLEHPAGSKAWAAHRLLVPRGVGWCRDRDGWSCEVWQSAYGHKARKRTWLYFCGEAPPARAAVDARARHAPVWLVRSHQAHAQQARSLAHPCRLRRVAHQPGRAGRQKGGG